MSKKPQKPTKSTSGRQQQQRTITNNHQQQQATQRQTHKQEADHAEGRPLTVEAASNEKQERTATVRMTNEEEHDLRRDEEPQRQGEEEQHQQQQQQQRDRKRPVRATNQSNNSNSNSTRQDKVITTSGSKQVEQIGDEPAQFAQNQESKCLGELKASVPVRQRRTQDQQLGEAGEPNTRQASSRGGPVPDHKQNICAACSKPIRERYLLMALDRHWHEDCLKCACCDCRLGEVGSSLFEHSDKLLCRRDFLRIFGKHGCCAACQRSIPPYEMVMRANKLAFHMDCFACQICKYRFCVGDHYHLTETHEIICLRCHADEPQSQLRQQQQADSLSSTLLHSQAPLASAAHDEQAPSIATAPAPETTTAINSGQQQQQHASDDLESPGPEVGNKNNLQQEQQVARALAEPDRGFVELTNQQQQQQQKRPPEQPPVESVGTPACKKRLTVGGTHQEQACVM